MWNARPIACVPEAHAVVMVNAGPVMPCSMLTRLVPALAITRGTVRG